MKKNFKKFVALLLSVLMLMSVMAVGACAEDAAIDAPTETEGEAHRGFIDIFVDFFMEFIGFIKYIFYDVFRGEPA